MEKLDFNLKTTVERLRISKASQATLLPATTPMLMPSSVATGTLYAETRDALNELAKSGGSETEEAHFVSTVGGVSSDGHKMPSRLRLKVGRQQRRPAVIAKRHLLADVLLRKSDRFDFQAPDSSDQ